MERTNATIIEDRRLFIKIRNEQKLLDWISLKPFVMEVRRVSQTPTFFCEFEYMAKKWANGAEKGRV
jgi:hypothetical protein